jgi:glycerol-3-phosphate dehydrogenase
MKALRDRNTKALRDGVFDVLVVGGGINGAVSAACCAGRGARVALVDRGDFASFTSQQSSNLAWGGIKYMETLEFGLVRKLCLSRNHLLRSYPSTVQEIRFFVTHEKTFKHGLLKLVVGAWLYWLIGALFTKAPRLLSQETIREEEPIVDIEGSDGGFEYSDAFLYDNDARFVWGFIRGAIEHGCVAANYVECLGAERRGELWVVSLRDAVSGETFTLEAKTFVNACGPFVDPLNEKTRTVTSHRHVFSKGIHLIVRRLTKSRRVLTFFADDGRPFFVTPMGPRTCIGTTDTRVGDPYAPIDDDDRQFVLDNINKRLRLREPLTMADIVAERCGVRPLVVSGKGESTSDWTQLSRKHVVEVDEGRKHLSIFGGKLTDCINVGEEVADALAGLGVAFPSPDTRWYGEPNDDVRDAFFREAERIKLDALTSPQSSEPLSTRLWRRYGASAQKLLEGIARDAREAEVLIEGAEYLRCEVELAARQEMIVKLEDFLRRRSKISLVMHHDALARAKGLREACKIFFGDDADRRWEEYFARRPAAAHERAAS